MPKHIRSFELQALFDDHDDLSIDEKLHGQPESLDEGDRQLLALLYNGSQESVREVVRKKEASVFRVKSARDLHSRGFVRVANTNLLVRISEKDFWEMEKDREGQLVVKRLFDPNGNPVKA